MTTSRAAPIGEGLGPEILLPPGESRFFSFAVERRGPIGFGVRAEADVIAAILLDGEGNKIDEGVVGMADLDPGRYLLALEARGEGKPVWARPALAGVDSPDRGPPEDVVRRYLEMAKEGASP